MKQDPDWHYLHWTNLKIEKFWNFAAHWEPWHADYFSFQVGAGIVRFLRYLTPFRGRILDYGCGIGDLSFHLLSAGIACEGVDSSGDSVEYINRRFQGNKLWGGALLPSGTSLPYPDDSMDLIICVETIEHILPEHVPVLLQELRRILKPISGQLFISTPHAESLALSQVYCAECSSVFHRFQHVSSFTKEDLATLMEENSYATTMCGSTHFGEFQESFIKSPLEWNLRYLPRLGQRGLILLQDALFPVKRPSQSRRFQSLIGDGAHLFWLGTKEPG